MSLDRKTPGDVSAFACYPFQIVSIDYVKSDRRVDSFVEDCPELVIVDEAHTCSVGDSGSRRQRISAKPGQHHSKGPYNSDFTLSVFDHKR